METAERFMTSYFLLPGAEFTNGTWQDHYFTMLHNVPEELVNSQFDEYQREEFGQGVLWTV